jgi:hypothetical protein
MSVTGCADAEVPAGLQHTRAFANARAHVIDHLERVVGGDKIERAVPDRERRSAGH